MKKISRNLKRAINQTAHKAGVAYAKAVKDVLMAKASHCLGNGESFDVLTCAETIPDLPTLSAKIMQQ